MINLPERHSRRAMLARPIARPLVHVRQLARRRFSLAVGSTGTASRTVETRVTAATLGSGSLEVFGTPAMVALMEESACNCVAAALEPGQTTVGTQVNIAHLRCTPMGMGVRAEATLTGIKGKMLTFPPLVHVHARDLRAHLFALPPLMRAHACRFRLL